VKALSEAQMRYLMRIARLMREGANCDVFVQLREGGVRDYQESTKFQHHQLPSPDYSLMQSLSREE
jgi:hypothetical protein